MTPSDESDSALVDREVDAFDDGAFRDLDLDELDQLDHSHVNDAPPVEADDEWGHLLGLRPVGEIAAEVDSADAPGWLFVGVWPEDAHGVLAASWKMFKTFLIMAAGVSVASGTPWLGLFEVQRPGRVILFLGEGGARKMTRRGRAIAAAVGLRWDDLPIVMAERVPRLRDDAAINALQVELGREPTALVIIDPLYLAAAGAKASQLYDMAEVLAPVQQACQAHGAALMIAHHNNRDSSRSGSERMSGAGPAEWGRVLCSVKQLSKREDAESGRGDAVLRLHFEGDEITGGDHTIRVSVWTDDPADLGSAMHFEAAPVADDEPDAQPQSPLTGASPSARRCHDALGALGDWRKASEIGDHLAEHGHPLKLRTIQQAMKDLVGLDLAESFGDDKGVGYSWRLIPEVDEEDEDAPTF